MLILYHGTTKGNAENIAKVGFISEHQGKNGSHFGKGIYLATTKKRAKCYGKVIVSVRVNPSRLKHFDKWEKWYPDYMKKCEETYERGTPANKVNEVVGETFRSIMVKEGYSGIMLATPMSRSKEVVVYDEAIIEKIFL